MKIKKILYMGVLCGILFLAGACGRSKLIFPEQIQEQIERNLNEKYQKEFAVVSLETEDVGQNFSYEIYRGKVNVLKTGEVFEVSADPNTGEISDNYAEILYASRIEEEVSALFETDFFTADEIELVYPLITEVWENCREYKKNAHVCIYGNIYLDDFQKESFERLEIFFSELEEEGYYFFLQVVTPYRSAYFGFDENDEETPSLEKIMSMLEEE